MGDSLREVIISLVVAILCEQITWPESLAGTEWRCAA